MELKRGDAIGVLVGVLIMQFTYSIFKLNLYVTDVPSIVSLRKLAPFITLFILSIVASYIHSYYNGKYVITFIISISVSLGLSAGVLSGFSNFSINSLQLVLLPALAFILGFAAVIPISNFYQSKTDNI